MPNRRPVPGPRLRRRGPLSVLAGLLLTACGGGEVPTRAPMPVAPTPAPPVLPTARDGWTDLAVAAEITPPQPGMRTAVVVRAPGYLTREALFEGAPLFLWPAEDGYIRELVYGDAPPWDRLQRWETPVRLTADAELLANGAVRAKLQEVAAEARRATGHDIAVAEQGNVEVVIEPQEESVAFADMRYRGYTLVSGRLVFWKLPEITGGHGSQYRNTLLHEFGHALGLGHSPEEDDVMIAGFGRGAKVGAFSEHETVTLRMMYRHRRAGNAFPDKAPELTARDRTLRLRRIVN